VIVGNCLAMLLFMLTNIGNKVLFLDSTPYPVIWKMLEWSGWQTPISLPFPQLTSRCMIY